MNTQRIQHTSGQRNIPLYAPGRDRPVAFFSPPLRLLHKTVADGRRHFLKVPPSIAFDDDILRQAGELGAVDIAVTDGSTGAIYRCTLGVFRAHCEVVDRGFGRQLCLRFTWWSRNGAPSEAEQHEAAEDARRRSAEVVQLQLFG